MFNLTAPPVHNTTVKNEPMTFQERQKQHKR